MNIIPNGTIIDNNGTPCMIACVPSNLLEINRIPEKEDVGIQPEIGYAINIKDVTELNPYYRRVLYSSTLESYPSYCNHILNKTKKDNKNYSNEEGIQLVIMSLKPEKI